MSGSTCVTMGASHTPSRSSSAITSSAARRCSSDSVKTMERYCGPTSAPWRLGVVGSCVAKKMRSRSRYDTTAGSKVTRTTSA